jgi:hypothetical protein
MRSILVGLVIASSTLFVGCASQTEGDSVTNADDRVICRSDRELGSAMTRRTCKKASEWESEREAQQEGMRSIDRQAQPTQGLGGEDIGG